MKKSSIKNGHISLPTERNAQSVVFAHNHPAGNLQPSVEDKEIFKKLRECGEGLEVKVLDALTVSDEEYFSFVENSLL